ncbi:cytochrome P450 [Xylariomycetidae sp. FL2044]|nr:cytochrome P450 [Xylariomycetidae sp. FL2044]
MGILMTPFGIALIGVAVSTYCLLWLRLLSTHDNREPPLAPGLIPFVSPIIGMRRWKGRFYTYMNDKYRQPIYTLRMGSRRVYVINSTALIPAVQRQSKTLSFDAVQVQGLENILGLSKAAAGIIGKDLPPGADDTFISRFIKAIHPALAAGPELDAMSSKAIETLEPVLAELTADGGRVVRLYDFVRRTILAATTDTAFGPLNPMKDANNVANWLKFESAIPLLSLGILPGWVAKEGLDASKSLAKTFEKYLTDKGQDQASGYMKRRVDFFQQEELAVMDIARLEVADLMSLNSSTIPMAFWLVYHIFSDRNILDDCRAEVSQAVHKGDDGIYTINFNHIKKSCPILNSTFLEVFRVHGMGLVLRRVLEDHLFDGRYLLKKGSMVFIPYRVQHNEPGNWGSDASAFYHKRFIKHDGAKRHHPAALRGFGSGAHLCPGRHFASAEILAFATMLILRFDASPVGGDWHQIPVENSSPAAALDQPDYDLEVELRPRGDVKEQLWRVNFSGV